MLAPLSLGLGAGLITTVAGMGGGMMLLLALSLMWDPHRALAVTAPALLVGNLHRLWMYRTMLDRSVAGPMVLGVVPGAVVGGLVAVALPAQALYAIMGAMTLLAVLKATLGWSWRPSPRLLTPAGAGVGVLTATGGGAGLLAAPVLMSAGLTGEAYVATGAACSLAAHAGRITAYGAGGLVDAQVLLVGGALAVAITAGNLLGAQVRRGISPAVGKRIELGALVLSATLVVIGVAR